MRQPNPESDWFRFQFPNRLLLPEFRLMLPVGLLLFLKLSVVRWTSAIRVPRFLPLRHFDDKSLWMWWHHQRNCSSGEHRGLHDSDQSEASRTGQQVPALCVLVMFTPLGLEFKDKRSAKLHSKCVHWRLRVVSNRRHGASALRALHTWCTSLRPVPCH